MDLSKVENGSHRIFSRFENWKIENQESACFPARKSRRSSDDLQNPCSKTPAMSSIRDLILLKTNLTKSPNLKMSWNGREISEFCFNSENLSRLPCLELKEGKAYNFGFQITNGINLSCFCRMTWLVLLLTGPYLSSKSFQKFPTNPATVWKLLVTVLSNQIDATDIKRKRSPNRFHQMYIDQTLEWSTISIAAVTFAQPWWNPWKVLPSALRKMAVGYRSTVG